MEALKLNENEQQRFEELFQMCDLAKTAKIPKLVVGELLASSGLATDVSLQVSGITVSSVQVAVVVSSVCVVVQAEYNTLYSNTCIIN